MASAACKIGVSNNRWAPAGLRLNEKTPCRLGHMRRMNWFNQIEVVTPFLTSNLAAMFLV
uniref:Uncharacterized protein n=1 Tax=Ciona intestinalis TaxID=7719 RepID=H2XTY9_CIOIN